MKKILFLFIAVFAMFNLNAQDIIDGLRYSTETLNGTARFNAMSGAFGALGGDLSAIQINPAGSAVFLSSSASVSISLTDKSNTVNYFNTITNSSDNDVTINQGGAVFVFDNTNSESDWKKFTLGINYELLNSFDDEIISVGTSNTSIDQYFLNFAQGVPLDLLQLQSGETISGLYSFLGQTEGTGAQNAFLGFQSFILDPVDNDPDNTAYFSNIAPGTFNQKHANFTTGYHSKYTANFAAQYKDNLYLGLNINSHVIDYFQTTFLFETNSNEGSLVNQVAFENNLAVLGAGFSAQFGAIAKLSDNFRVGLSYSTPTWFTISEETTQRIETQLVDDANPILIDPNIVNIFADYDLQTPGKVTASAAVLFGKKGLLSFDYTYKNYSNIEFSPKNDASFAFQNNIISNSLQAASSYRLGGEFRVKEWSFRGGARYEESPYKDTDIMDNLLGFSAGVGYNFGDMKLDISYARTDQKRKQQLYSVGLTNTSSIDATTSNVVFTLSYSL